MVARLVDLPAATVIVSEVLSATSAGEVCQSIDNAFSNAEPALTCADILAPPTLEDQCKNGAWKIYGIFKNQGDCVAFVRTNATNPHIGRRRVASPR